MPGINGARRIEVASSTGPSEVASTTGHSMIFALSVKIKFEAADLVNQKLGKQTTNNIVVKSYHSSDIY